MAYHRLHGENPNRSIFNTYGPRRPNDAGSSQLYGQPSAASPSPSTASHEQTRSFCYVTDLAEGSLDS
jgi:nucleoside-diphosphate-sugar epimerase